MGTFVITSRLAEDFREELEQILFFNPTQHKATADIQRCVERYGVPEITVENGYLRIGLDSRTVAQTLYTIDRTNEHDILAGAIVYIRNSLEDISILHVAISTRYIMRGPVMTARLVWDLIRQVINAASRISGVKNVKLAYPDSSSKCRATITSIPVSKPLPEREETRRRAVICPDESITCFEYQYCSDCPNPVASKTRDPLVH